MTAITAFAVNLRKHYGNNPTLGLVSLGFATLGGIYSRISEDRLERCDLVLQPKVRCHSVKD